MSISEELLSEIVNRFMRSVGETGQDYDAATLIASCTGGVMYQYGYIYHPNGTVSLWEGQADTAVFLCDYRTLGSTGGQPWDACVIRIDQAAGRLDVEHLNGSEARYWHLSEHVIPDHSERGRRRLELTAA